MEVAIIGCGVMGSALAKMLTHQGHKVSICDRRPESLAALKKEIDIEITQDPGKATKGAALVILAVKPNHLEQVARALQPEKGQLYVSILAGVTVGTLKGLLAPAQVIRAMPNLALRTGQGVMALVDDDGLCAETKGQLDTLFRPLGMTLWVEESKINAITALAGSGPAFVIAMIEAMVEGGIAMGLRADEAKALGLQTFLGSIALLKQDQSHPGDLRWKICAPGGTTIAGMRSFEAKGVRSGIIETLLATLKKAEEME